MILLLFYHTSVIIVHLLLKITWQSVSCMCSVKTKNGPGSVKTSTGPVGSLLLTSAHEALALKDVVYSISDLSMSGNRRSGGVPERWCHHDKMPFVTKTVLGWKTEALGQILIWASCCSDMRSTSTALNPYRVGLRGIMQSWSWDVMGCVVQIIYLHSIYLLFFTGLFVHVFPLEHFSG